jgi:hypothetical protein
MMTWLRFIMKKNILYLIVLLICSFSVIAGSLYSGLDFYYSFNDASKTVDSTGNYTSAKATTVNNITGKRSSGIGFDAGASDNWNFSNNYCGNNFTVVFWYKMSVPDESWPIGVYGGSNDAWSYKITSAATEHFTINGGSVGTPAGGITKSWHFITLMRNGRNFRIYQNGTKIFETTTNDPNCNASAYALAHNYFQMSGQPSWDYQMTGLFDELAAWHRNLNSSDILLAMNCEFGSTCFGYVPPAGHEAEGSSYYSNKSLKTSFSIGQEFVLGANFTASGVVLSSGECNFSTVKRFSEDHFAVTNLSLCASCYNGASESLSISISKGFNDSVHFTGCAPALSAGDVTIRFSCAAGVFEKTILGGQFPICPTTAFLRASHGGCRNNVSVNVTILNPYSSPRRKVFADASFDRQYGSSVLESAYDAGNKMFWSDELELYDAGKQLFNLSCYDVSGSDTDQFNVTVLNDHPSIFHDNIVVGSTSYIFVNGTNIEFAADPFRFIAGFVDSDLKAGNTSIYCVNGSLLVFNSTTKSFNASYAKFVDFDCSPFTVTSLAGDNAGNRWNLSTVFVMADTVNPQVSGAINYSVDKDALVNVTLIFSDEYLFSVNLTCNDSFSSVSTGLNVQTKSLSHEFETNGTVQCKLRFCDGHTALFLDDLSASERTVDGFPALSFKNKRGENTLVLESSAEDFSLESQKLDDRIAFSVSSVGKEFAPSKIIFSYITSDAAYYFPSEKFSAWIVDGKSETWFDMNGNAYDWIVSQRSPTEWIIESTTDILEEELSFSSIGALNCVDKTFYIKMNSERPWDDLSGVFDLGVCAADTTADVLMLAFIFALIFCMIILNQLWIRFPFIDFVLGVTMILLGFYVTYCHQLAGLSVIVFGIGVIMKAFF